MLVYIFIQKMSSFDKMNSSIVLTSELIYNLKVKFVCRGKKVLHSNHSFPYYGYVMKEWPPKT